MLVSGLKLFKKFMPTTLNAKRITIITGHYGSGKSEFAINFAILKKFQTLVDLDIINPYFRSRELTPLLASQGIEVISSPLGSAPGSDLPYIDAASFRPFLTNEKALYDLGGNASGALLMQQFTDIITEDLDFLLCVNVYREETKDSAGIIKMINSIEGASGLKLTGIINNSHLLRETKVEDILYGQRIIDEVVKEVNIPLCYTGVWEKVILNKPLKGEIIPLALYLRPSWL